jgi:hypothetical protein
VHVEIGPSAIQAESKFSQIGPSPHKDNPVTAKQGSRRPGVPLDRFRSTVVRFGRFVQKSIRKLRSSVQGLQRPFNRLQKISTAFPESIIINGLRAIGGQKNRRPRRGADRVARRRGERSPHALSPTPSIAYPACAARPRPSRFSPAGASQSPAVACERPRGRRDAGLVA